MWTATLRCIRPTDTTRKPFLGFARTTLPSTSANGPFMIRTR
jgi:hypothetical protein